MEWAIQQYFDVDSDYLRTSVSIKAEENTYYVFRRFL